MVVIDIMKIIIIVDIFQLINLDIIKISLRVLIVGGAEMLTAININHQNMILGIISKAPLNNRIFREWYFVYMSLTRKKRADEESPWAIIIIIAPVRPIDLMEKIPVSTNPMWATEEYAINDFKSFWRMQLRLVAVAPIKLILIIHKFILLIVFIHNGINRIIPYPPSFSRIAAKIIDPSRGASTCAFGNHKWVKYIGVFTRNAISIIIGMLKFNIIVDAIMKEGLFFRKIILVSSGKDAMIVYIIK